MFSSKIKKRFLFNQPDYGIMVIVGLIILFGLFILSSASNIYSYQRFGNTYHILLHQIYFGIIPGIIIFYMLMKIDYHIWKKYYLFFLFFSLGILLLVFIPKIGATYDRAQSWVNIAGLSFQPSEIVKLTFIIFLAGWLENKGYLRVRGFWSGFIPFVLILSLILIPIGLQPDFGTMMIIAIFSILIFFIAGARYIHLAVLGVTSITAIVWLAIKTTYLSKRLMVFIHPELDPQGIGYHINQAFLAIGAGGLFGRGFGKSEQKFAYLPEVSSDSIFAIIAEELGFFVAVGLICLYIFFAYRGFKIARDAPDPFGRLIAAGIICWLVFQAFVNIAVMVGLMPMTGIPLPFISQGGTALVTSLAAVGILLNISKQTVK